MLQPRRNVPDKRMPQTGMKATNVAPRFNNNAGSQAGPGRRTEVGFNNDFRVGKGGQLSVGTKGGGRSWLGQAETDEGSLVPLGVAKNGYQQFGRVNIGNYTNQNPMSQGTPFAKEGMDRAGFADDFGWDPVGKANTQAWKGMLGTGAYQNYGRPTGVFADVGIQKYGQTPFQGLAQRSAQDGGGARNNPRPPDGQGGLPNQGVPGATGGGGQGGGRPGGGRPNGQGGGRAGGQQNRGNRGGQRPGYPGVGTPGAMGEYANFPAPQAPAQDFLPMTPQFEAGRRGLADEQMSQQTDILAQQAMVDPLYQQQKARMETNQQYDVERMKESLANRGVFTPFGPGGFQQNPQMGKPLSTGGGIGAYLGQRDIQIPYGREFSDLATNAAGQYGGLSNAYGDTELAYNQGLAELLLNRASDAAQNISMGVPQWSTGGRNLRGQNYNNRPNKPNKNRGRSNRGRRNK